ncbi:aldehyde ferredoxin oxidoreductase N-terminal domain-containing protein [Desulfotomaculum nigrificans]|uniref:aldehyde ferredoxin oxidoreductase N-terminal domain-containing protein n=1 Tax=Desulfotomaculum nigrificans TaxID=1565 RepID=UPI0002EB860B|nr:aldehyde ferredoxin oxidoreductase N-terminal domain-containing protein [Desulfotomaculum nigrificans]
MSGYVNRFLDVDLSRMKLQDMQLPKGWLENYIGGSGLGAKILVENTDPKIDPLGPENILCFLTGPLTGTTVPGSGRHSIVAKSPLTNIWGEASVGGYWGRELKRAGYDGVIVRGQAPKPVYLWINDGKAELREAGHVWGKDTYETDALLRKETDHKAVVSCIGPSGEKMIPIAGVFTDGK